MHEALECGEFALTEDFLARFDVRTEKEYLNILRAGFNRLCVLHERTLVQKFVNAFDPWVVKILDLNMDLPIILDHYACATFIVDYVNKANRGISNLHKAMLKVIKENPDMDYASVLRVLGVNMLKSGGNVFRRSRLVPSETGSVSEEPRHDMHSHLLPRRMNQSQEN